MSRQNVAFLSIGNRGLVSPKALARVDLDRTRLSAETYNNFTPKTQGAMTIRPGTKYLGSSYSDSGAAWIEFVASTDDVALLEITNAKMRIWQGSDAHNLSLLGRPSIITTASFTDTGWDNTSTGGAFATASIDLIPTLSGYTQSGVTISASSDNTVIGNEGAGYGHAWRAGDDSTNTNWYDTGSSTISSLPSWWKINFGAGNTKGVRSYSIRASASSGEIDSAPSAWTLQYNDVDTGEGWTTVDSRSGQTSWSVSEKKTFTRLDADTGTIEAFRYWRLNFTAIAGAGPALVISEIEMFDAATAQQAKFSNGSLTLNASSIGALGKATRRVLVDTGDVDVEHSLNINVSRGPVTLRVGSTLGEDDYVSETYLGTGYHNLAFTPSGTFYILFQSQALVDRIVSSIAIGDTGTVEIAAPWSTNDLGNIRYDQSADVVYVDCDGIKPYKIERRGTGRSWSIVEYQPNDGPFLPAASSSAKLSVSYFFGNTTMNSDVPVFSSGHVGGLFRVFHNGQDGIWRLGALNAATDAIKVTGISDTGTGTTTNERRIAFSVTGTYTGTITIERSFEGPDVGFKTISSNAQTPTDTGTFTEDVDDRDDNIAVWYRARMTSYTSGVAVVSITYGGGGVHGIARVTGYNSNTDVSVEVLSRFSDTGTSDSWQEGYWSGERSYPSAVALHGGRLGHASGGNIFLSASDDYENFDDTVTGDAAPIIRTLGSGPVDSIRYLVSLLRLIIGTDGSEVVLRSSSLDEPVTRANSSAGTISTQGSANLRALKMDGKAIFAQRSLKRLFMIGPGSQGSSYGDYESSELTMLVPDLLSAGIVSIAIQRQPDTRLHCVLADGTVAILTYEPQEEVMCWTTWSTNGAVEAAAVLPGTPEDAVFHHIRRTINGVTKRYLEKWAKEEECLGDTGLSWLADCAKSYTDTGRSATLTGFSHLAGASVVVWADDTGQSTPGKDLSPDVAGVQTTYAVNAATGNVTLNEAVHHAVVGLPYTADWKSTKLAYAAEAGSALAQMKRVDKIAFVLYKTHNNGVYFGSDTGTLDPLPRVIDGGAAVDPDKIFETFDKAAMPFPGLWDTDSRVCLRGKAPRPLTVLALVPTVQTNEKI